MFEQILKIQHYPYQDAVVELKRLHSMSVDEFLHWQKEQSWQMAKFHYQHNPLYKQLVGSVFPDRWEDLPIVTKQHLQQPLQQIITRGVKLKNCHHGSTSGSTGVPFRYAKDKYAHAMTWAIIANRYGWYGLTLSSKQARFYGIPKEFLANRKERTKDRLMNRHRFSVFDMSAKAMDGFIHKFSKTNFAYVYGYTNSLVMFARHLTNKGLILKDITPSLNVTICTSETCTPEDRKILAQGFGVPIVREYGLSETCVTAFDKNADWLLTEETLFTEVVNNQNTATTDGAEGQLLSTSLYNKALPMIRYNTGDRGVLTGERKEIYRVLGQLTGRTNDTIILPSGKEAAGLTFYYIARSVLEMTGVLQEFIVRQTETNKFVFDIVADRDLKDREKDLVREKVSLYLEPEIEILFNRVPAIERPESGKLKHFYSELK